MKRLFYIILLLVIFGVVGCQSHMYTPPIATPNQNLPLREPPPSPTTSEPEASDVGGAPSPDYKEPTIEADPSTIYVQGSNLVTEAKISVSEHAFNPDSYVDIWGEVPDTSVITSPPLVPSDMLNSESGVQLKTDDDGGIEFMLKAGSSSGEYEVHVSDGVTDLSVTIKVLSKM